MAEAQDNQHKLEDILAGFDDVDPDGGTEYDFTASARGYFEEAARKQPAAPDPVVEEKDEAGSEGPEKDARELLEESMKQRDSDIDRTERWLDYMKLDAEDVLAGTANRAADAEERNAAADSAGAVPTGERKRFRQIRNLFRRKES